jgi:hypothetical protein
MSVISTNILLINPYLYPYNLITIAKSFLLHYGLYAPQELNLVVLHCMSTTHHNIPNEVLTLWTF